jgi:catechol 2,3-dioxygenase-like lactoylglutathione lyase family enzyme
MEVRSSFPIVYVDDMPASVCFYRDLLGFEEMYRFPDTDEPGYVALRLDDGKIGLSSGRSPDARCPHPRPEIRMIRNSRKRSASIPTAAWQFGSQPMFPCTSRCVRPRESSGPVSTSTPQW